MRAKNEYKFLEEAYSQVNEGFDDVGKGPVRDAARQGAVPVDPGSALARAFAASQTAEGPPNPGPDDLGPDRESERPPVQVGSHVMWDKQRRFGIVDELDDPENPTVAFVLDDDGAESIVDVKHLEEISGPIEDAEDHPKQGITGLQHTDALAQAAFAQKDETHKPYVSSYMPFHRDEDDKLKPSKKIFAVLDKRGNAIFTSNNKDEAYKWFDDNFKDLRDEGEEFDKEEDYWTPELTDEDKIKDHGPVIKKDLLTPEEEKKIDANREKLKAPKKSSRHWELNRPGRRDK